MARDLKKTNSGVTLMELLIAMTLFVTIMFAATSLFISFKRQYIRYTTSETSLATTSLAAVGEIIGWITVGNQVTMPNSSTIQIRVDNRDAPTPGTFTNDITYSYWRNAADNTIRFTANGTLTGGQVIATDVTALSFTYDDPATNRVKIVLTSQPANGARETIETTVVARSRRAQT